MQDATIAGALSSITARLTQAGVISADVDALLLVGHALSVTSRPSTPISRGRVQALAIMGERLTSAQLAVLQETVARRVAREPLQHITGTAPFMDFELAVGRGVFVPRPETELLAALAAEHLQFAAHPAPVALDLCAGSGAIAIALARAVPRASVVAVEKSPEAAEWASRNIRGLGQGRVRLVRGDATDPVLLPELAGQVQVLVSNPPYVPADDVPADPEVARFDPPAALYGGADGLDVIRGIFRQAGRLCAPGALVALEHTEQQGSAVRELAGAHGFLAAATHRDLTGRDRFTTAIAP